jgi:RNA polymerase sigma-70 factor (ECF subfamily)
MDAPFDWSAAFEAERDYLFGVAYRMLGSAAEADDVLQDAWIRVQASDEVPRSARAYLTTVVTRLSIDALTSARARRETYVGPWLPEPILAPAVDAPRPADDRIDLTESLGTALLLVLESLSPLERAAFLLREVFEYEYAELAVVLGRSEAACRQLHHRAKDRVLASRPRFAASPEEVERMLLAFVQAATAGDARELEQLLADDVVATTDGGGRVRAARNVVAGKDHVARFVLGLAKKGAGGVEFRQIELNGAPALLAYKDGKLTQALWLEIDRDRIRAVCSVLNPAKLARLESTLAAG